MQQLQSIINKADQLFSSLSRRERQLFREAASLSIPDVVRSNPTGRPYNSDYFMEIMVKQMREYSISLSSLLLDLPVEQEKGGSQRNESTKTFKHRFDFLVGEMIQIAKELNIPISARKDRGGVSDFVALISESLRAFEEDHTEENRDSLSAGYSKKFKEAGYDAKSIASLDETWRNSYEFALDVLNKYNGTDTAISEAVGRALKRVG